ncbi:hypothetical protein [Streptomyces sp. NBC_01235]|uniref:hypothetical protein n=1 Tax=Streptomyces sp. NBC_01235 TaxID=2903788 RepID=UPI002E14AA72|nr:hypothetical protein OG289_04880 [Streptomyces sp. NBC_01235]
MAWRAPDTVSAIHLGLMQGAVETLRVPLTAESLQLRHPHRCVAPLQRTGAA